jgi:hypothetical protein
MAEAELPFSARYSLPAQVSQNIGEVTWETVFELSGDFQAKCADREGKVKKIVKELQMSRLLLMERIKEGTGTGRIDPQLLVDVVKLLRRCEWVAQQYSVDLKEFSTFLYVLSEKLKKEKLARHMGSAAMEHITPMDEELANFKSRSEASGRPAIAKRNGKGKSGKRGK